MIEHLNTEKRNERTANLDQMSVHEILAVMNEEDKRVPLAIAEQLPQIEAVVKAVITVFEQGGRLFYIGAGTSGRLGILDAVECVPTFGTEAEMVQGLIAGGAKAIKDAVEGAEDSTELAVADLQAVNLNEKDIVIGIAASGRTPYVIGGLDYATTVGAMTASIACNAPAEISAHAQLAIEVVPGAEILTGSTRLKAGTTQKLVLNMISTTAMIGIGKVYKNLMVDVRSTNIKLVQRAKNIIKDATGCDEATAERVFEESNHHVKTAIVMVLTGMDYTAATKSLVESKGFVRRTLPKL
ncbi:N-acetylmuramic acid 6-phosphate etherase [Brochothrix campestris]|uniref:N-acetylmuramic acid 6-phosphate etherase n=1 Tax=Brochothrix campestris FSL F6-1037 TaxID=1265861 RepID=W7CX86_9LIST|nr:N-acetylmuramic acid 6-phosphate etherase [Brochothrix campestris]EUJ41587.1 N-acetylmuramic acid-6-phosphate etherase [Brochothrix campestris FSL F6-1037]